MSGQLADVNFEARGEECILAVVAGEIDSSNAAELQRAVADNVPAAAQMLVLDLSATSYVDSAGVELIFELARRLAARRQDLAVIAPPDSGVRRVLELCDVGSVARLEASLREVEADGDPSPRGTVS